jgi:hypothetical protein
MRHHRGYRDDNASWCAAVNARKSSPNSGRRVTPLAPPCVPPLITTILSVGRTDASWFIAARFPSTLPMRPRVGTWMVAISTAVKSCSPRLHTTAAIARRLLRASRCCDCTCICTFVSVGWSAGAVRRITDLNGMPCSNPTASASAGAASSGVHRCRPATSLSVAVTNRSGLVVGASP